MAMADASGCFVADKLKAERLSSNRLVSKEYGIVDVKSSQFNKNISGISLSEAASYRITLHLPVLMIISCLNGAILCQLV
jgi:hypothetical protein